MCWCSSIYCLKNILMKFTQAVLLHQNGSLARKLEEKNLFEVKTEFVWFLNREDKKEYIVVPAGFTTDLASIPRIFWGLFDRYRVSSILHDYLYQTHTIASKNAKNEEIYRPCTFHEANYIYFQSLRTEWVGILEAILQYTAVTLFWKKHYDKHQKPSR